MSSVTDDRPHWQVTAPTTEQLSDGIRAMNAFIARHMHPEHTKDTVCLPCFNHRLTNAPWTFKPGQRYIKVGRYVQATPRPGFTERYGMRA